MSTGSWTSTTGERSLRTSRRSWPRSPNAESGPPSESSRRRSTTPVPSCTPSEGREHDRHLGPRIIAALLLLGLAASLRIIKQYERGVQFRVGRVAGAREPGVIFIVPLVDRVHRVSLRIVTMPI